MKEKVELIGVLIRRQDGGQQYYKAPWGPNRCLYSIACAPAIEGLLGELPAAIKMTLSSKTFKGSHAAYVNNGDLIIVSKHVFNKIPPTQQLEGRWVHLWSSVEEALMEIGCDEGKRFYWSIEATEVGDE